VLAVRYPSQEQPSTFVYGLLTEGTESSPVICEISSVNLEQNVLYLQYRGNIPSGNLILRFLVNPFSDEWFPLKDSDGLDVEISLPTINDNVGFQNFRVRLDSFDIKPSPPETSLRILLHHSENHADFTANISLNFMSSIRPTNVPFFVSGVSTVDTGRLMVIASGYSYTWRMLYEEEYLSGDGIKEGVGIGNQIVEIRYTVNGDVRYAYSDIIIVKNTTNVLSVDLTDEYDEYEGEDLSEEISDGNALLLCGEDEVLLYYDDVLQMSAYPIEGEMYLDLSGWSIINAPVSGTQESFMKDIGGGIIGFAFDGTRRLELDTVNKTFTTESIVQPVSQYVGEGSFIVETESESFLRYYDSVTESYKTVLSINASGITTIFMYQE